MIFSYFRILQQVFLMLFYLFLIFVPLLYYFYAFLKPIHFIVVWFHFFIYTTFSIFFLLFILVLFLHSRYTTNAIVSKPDLVKLAVLLKLPTLPCEARWNMLYWIRFSRRCATSERICRYDPPLLTETKRGALCPNTVRSFLDSTVIIRSSSLGVRSLCPILQISC